MSATNSTPPTSTFPTPINDRYFEDYVPGAVHRFGEMRWLEPVRPDDVLSTRVTIVEARRSASKPDRGLVRSKIEVLNQHDRVVLSMLAMNLVGCRKPGVN